MMDACGMLAAGLRQAGNYMIVAGGAVVAVSGLVVLLRRKPLQSRNGEMSMGATIAMGAVCLLGGAALLIYGLRGLMK